jgi:hypothetical protein
MGVQIIGTFSGQTNGTVTTVDNTIEFVAIKTAIDGLTLAVNANLNSMILFNIDNFSPAGVETPGTPISVLAAQGAALNHMSSMMASMMKTQSEMATKLTGVQVGLAQVSSQVAAGVTTSQIHLAETIKNNKFQQQTTNAALERSGIEPTVVTPASLTATITDTINTVGPVKAAMAATNLVEQGIGSAISWTSTTVTNLIAESYIGTAAANAFTTVKGWINLTKPEETVKAATAEASALKAKATTVDV